ncbi:MAG: FG-GAP-like repeat-containing protein, partial [Cyanobacteria bacterium P01_C01_bin.72]
GDFDGDGNADLIYSAGGEIAYYRLDENNIFQLVTNNPFADFDLGGTISHSAIDLDGDGDLDAVVKSSNSNTSAIYLNNEGVLSRFTGEVNLPSGINLNNPEAIFAVDEDNDGDLDVVYHNSDGSLSLFRNNDGRYSRVAESNNPFTDIDLAGGFPGFGDTDGDGDADLLVGNANGGLDFYENRQIRGDLTPIAASDLFEVFSQNPQELNVLFNDYGAQGQALTITAVDENSALGGTIAIAENRLIYTPPQEINSPTEDSFSYTVTDESGQTATATVSLTVLPRLFVPQTGEDNPFGGFDVGTDSTPLLFDLDFDGDLDLFSGNGGGTIDTFENIEGVFIPLEGTDNPFNGLRLGNFGTNSAVAIADFDRDDDVDFVGGSSATNNELEYFYYRNDNGSVTRLTDDNQPIEYLKSIGSNIKPVAVDWNNDGWIDLVSTDSNGLLHYFQNQSGTLIEVNDSANPFQAINQAGTGQELDIGRDASVAFLDWDRDGDLDLMVGQRLGSIIALRNDDNSWTRLTGQDHPLGEDIDIGIRATVAVGDVDNDGDLDLIAGNDDGTFRYWSASRGDLVNNLPPDSEISLDVPDNTVFRFFNEAGFHFYTTSTGERDYIIDNLSNYQYEGGADVAADPLLENPEVVPVYRLFNNETGSHLYTTSQTEVDFIQANLPNLTLEGEAFYAYNSQVEGSIPIYRFFNDAGSHFYTPSSTERDYVDENLDNYRYEGIAYYADPFPSDVI